MAQFEVFAGVQPYEEQQSPPSPIDERPTELHLALSRTRSPSSSHSPTSPTALHRQLSGDPNSPPPAWKRRPSQRNASNSSQRSYATADSAAAGVPPSSPPQPFPYPHQQQHQQQQQQQQQQLGQQQQHRKYQPPNLAMTRAGVAQRMLRDDGPTPAAPSSRARAPPPPSFRGRRQGTLSNRSSMLSMEGLNSEELWALEDDTPDMSNPMRSSQERPLDTVRRMSQMYDIPVAPLPENLWPSAPPTAEYMLPTKNKSATSLSGMKKRHTLRKSSSRATSIVDARTSPSLMPIKSKDGLSSAHSSSTDLSIPFNKSQQSLSSSRPGSQAYGFDLLSALAPREGGYAIAAQIGGHQQQFSPTSSQHSYEDRRSYVGPPHGNRSRAPSARSSGMGMRSSGEGLDFGYSDLPLPGRISTHTTSSNLSAMGDEPDSPTAPVMPAVAQMAAPTAPSPLSQHTTAADVSAPPTPIADRAQHSFAHGVPAAAAVVAPVVVPPPKTKKELKAEEKERAKEAKLEAKRAAEEQSRAKLEAARQAAAAKALAKADAARKEREEKERVKAEKKAKKASRLLKPAPAASKRASVSPQPSASSAMPSSASASGYSTANGSLRGPPNGVDLPNGNAGGHSGAAAAVTGAAAATAAAAAVASRSTPSDAPIHARPLPSPPRGSSMQAQQQSRPQQPRQPSQQSLPPPAPSQQARQPSPQNLAPMPTHAPELTPSSRSVSSTSVNSEQTARKKSGMLSGLKKRFSVVMDHPPAVPGKPRPASMAPVASPGQEAGVAPAPAPAPAATPTPPPAPVVIPPRGSSAIAIPPRQSSAHLAASYQNSAPADDPVPAARTNPVIVPPRASSLAIPDPSPPTLSQSPDGSADYHPQPYASTSSSVVVTPTTSMATNSQPSLFDLRPSAPFRDRSDSTASGAASVSDDVGYSSCVDEKPIPVTAH